MQSLPKLSLSANHPSTQPVSIHTDTNASGTSSNRFVCCPVSVTDALNSLLQSARLIERQPFARTQIFSTAVLAPEDWFEHHLLRDSEPHEIALFGPAESKFDPAELDGQAEDSRWIATKRKGPKRTAGTTEVATPLREKKTNQDPKRCLLAADKLLKL